MSQFPWQTQKEKKRKLEGKKEENVTVSLADAVQEAISV